MKQLELNATKGEIWDLILTGTPAQLQLTEDKDYIAQKAKQIYLTVLNEVFTDKDVGIPWFRDIFGKKNADLSGIQAMFEEAITENAVMVELGVTGCSIGNIQLGVNRKLIISDLVITAEDSEDVSLGSVEI